MTFQPAATVWRDFVTDGVPASGPWKPLKADVRAWGTYLEGIAGGVPVTAESFGAVGNGVTNDASAIQNAINSVYAAGGGVVTLQAKAYAIGGTISVKAGVRLVGIGSGQYPLSANISSPSFLATKKTRLVALAGFAAGTPMIDFNSSGEAYAIHAAGLSGIMVDCANIADIGVRLRSVKHCNFRDLLIFRPTTAKTSRGMVIDCVRGAATGQIAAAGGASTITFKNALAVPRDNWFVGAVITTTGGTGSGQTRTVSAYNGATKVATVSAAWTTPPDATTVFSITGELTEGYTDTSFNRFEDITVWLGSTGSAVGIELAGDGIGDTNQNAFSRISVVHANGPGIRYSDGDTDWWDGVSTYAFGVAYGLELWGSESAGYDGYTRNIFMSKMLLGGANLGGTSGTAQAGSSTTITLAAGASSVDDFYTGKLITLTGGTGNGQIARIDGYVGSSRVATVSAAWGTNPDATTTYSIANGGGLLARAGTAASSGAHMFSEMELQGNGAKTPVGEAGAYFSYTTERETHLGDTTGHVLALESQTSFSSGAAQPEIRMRGRLGNGQMADAAGALGILLGTAGNEVGRLYLKTRNGGAYGIQGYIGNGLAMPDTVTNGDRGIGTINLSAGYYVQGNQVVGPRSTGWTAGTGTALKTAWAAYAGQTHTASYVQGTVQALDNAARDTSQRVKAIEDALRTHGLIN